MLNILESTEREILGSLIQSGEIAYQSCTRLRPDMLSLDSHRRLYALMVDMLAQGITLDVLTLRNELMKRNMLDSVGGFAYIVNLDEGLPRNFNPERHVSMAIEAWKIREVRRICSVFDARAKTGDDAGEILGAMQAQVMDALEESQERDEPLVSAYSAGMLREWITAAQSTSQDIQGLSYGLTMLDQFTDGMQPGEVTAVGARSGVGKSTLMLQAARRACSASKPVHLFSLEMSRKQCLHRLWSIESGVPFHKVRRPAMATESEVYAIEQAALRVDRWPLRIHDKSDMDLGQIAAMARLSIRQHGTQLFCIDYAQNVEDLEKDERKRVMKVSRTLTKIAKGEGAHMMLLSQLRKVPSEMYSKPPHVGDLRETGQIENDAHVILLLHRPWDEEMARVADHGEILIPKQRSGETGSLEIQWNRKTATFEDIL